MVYNCLFLKQCSQPQVVNIKHNKSTNQLFVTYNNGDAVSNDYDKSVEFVKEVLTNKLDFSRVGLRLIPRHVSTYFRRSNLPYITSDQSVLKPANKFYEAAVAFGISTIVLGVQNSKLKAELDDQKANITTSTILPVTVTTPFPENTTPAPDDMSKYKLPTTVKPLAYDLYLFPDLETGLFKGKVTISLDVLSATDSVVLNSKLLTIDKVTIGSDTATFSIDDDYELVTIQKSDGSNFPKGSASVEIEFNGDMKSRIVGLYTSSYTTVSGENRIRNIIQGNVNERIFWRLPNDTKPMLYNLTLLPDLTTGEFKGSVNITVRVMGFRKDFIVHSKHLYITDIGITSPHRTLKVINIDENLVDEVLVITTREKIFPGVYYLYIQFGGSLKNGLSGFYQSQYRTSTGNIRQIATSKFEPTYARQAFPCFDEPNMKSQYTVHLLKPKNESYIALSNYPVNKIEDYDDTHQLVTFEETVSMSTYLACFIVSDFSHTETTFENNGTTIPLKVYASPDNLEKTSYAGEVGKKVIEYYVKYFGIPYPLPKLDMVAIPDFVSGAMEHWGLVTYRETALLYTNITHSTANKQRVATVVAHELAHSWFGNLVTMDWWNDLWLNEGFASYIEYKGVLAAEPTWGMLDQFLTSELHPVLGLDATLSSHPIVQTVITPDQITEIFDTISYNKSQENFQKETNYLKHYAYSNAVTANFLSDIQGVVGDTFDVAEMMDTFTAQMGYPLLTVSADGDNYTLTQSRFLKDPKASYNSSESNYGAILSFSVTIQKPSGASWLKFNYDQIGYYRVNYPEQEWNTLISNYQSFSTSDRTHVLEELFSLAEAGHVDYALPLNLTKKLSEEIEYTPWSVASSALGKILKYLYGSSSAQEQSLKNYVSRIVTPAYQNLTWTDSEGDGHIRRLARIEVLSLACAVGHEECLSEAESQFNNWIDNRTSLSQDLRSLIYKYGMKSANEETFQKLLENYKIENDASEKLKLINGLANVQNTSLLSSLIDLSKNESIVRSQDYFSVLQYISLNPLGTPLVWNFVRENWEYLVERFTLNNRYLGSLIPAITSSFATQERLIEMQEFFAKYPNAGAGTANRAKALETVQNNIRWLALYKSAVEDWITSSAGNI
ncbi:hypothetical protein NQ317_003676 [Molorchus minor]|uniref:glutamyl aminopeptidase n=1 Tax=Molorchus minor TaxID=1323400 RepID=A0ABQ9JPS5_9CUCU|nr:hypothetical protein NQ317_003676 [Molorchus minor]